MNVDRILALAERVEGATGSDREIDLAISVAINFKDAFVSEERQGEWRWGFGSDEIERRRPDGVRSGYLDPAQFVPRWTASLDAAMLLVPEGCRFYVDNGTLDDGASHACAYQQRPQKFSGGCKGAATPALALTASCLRAIAAGEG